MMKLLFSNDTGARSLGSNHLIPGLKSLAEAHNASFITTGGYGLYALEPMLVIEHDEHSHVFSNLEACDIETLINQSKPNTNHPRYQGLLQSLNGIKHQTRFTFKRAGIIDPISLSDYQNHGGFKGLQKALNLDAQTIINTIKDSGLRGRGGAGFPTGIKWQTVLDTESREKYIVCNADEGDSGTFADRLIMESDPFTLIEGMVIAGKAVKASKGYIYLRSEYPFTHQIMTEALQRAYEGNLLGNHVLGSDFSFDLALRKGAGSYICGEETALLESLEGKRGTIRYKPPLPAIQGLFGQPTALNNVITLASIPEILAQGAEAYSNLGSGRSKGTLTIQLAGNIKNGGLYEIPFGIPLSTLLFDIGGGSLSGKPIKAVQVGGPLGAYFPPSLFDVPLDYEAFASHEGMLGHGGIVVFDETADLSDQARFAFEFCAHESCGKCTPCRIGSTRGAELVQQIQDGKNNQKTIALVSDLCELMEQTSLCALGGLTPFPVKSALKHFPEDFGLPKNETV